MSRYDGPSTRKHQRGEPFRVEKRAKLKVKKGGGPNEWSQKGKGAVKNSQAGITPLKRRLRSLGRLLSNNEKLPADVRVGHEREIQALQHELVELILDKQKHEMIGKYHKVRFFERQRATRILKKAKKELEACEDDAERKKLKRKVHVAEVDFNYPQYYPYMTVYQSLWKKEAGEDGEDRYTPNAEQEDGAKGNAEVWRKVKQTMKDGSLEKLKDFVDEAKMEKIRTEVASLCRTGGGQVKAKDGAATDGGDEEEDDTGAGFFE